MDKIKKYRQLQKPVLIVNWDNSDETLSLINKELCSKLESCHMQRMEEPNADTMYIKNVNAFGTLKIFVRIGDYVILDLNKESSPILTCQQKELDEMYELI